MGKIILDQLAKGVKLETEMTKVNHIIAKEVIDVYVRMN